jgi:hypothetical protein
LLNLLNVRRNLVERRKPQTRQQHTYLLVAGKTSTQPNERIQPLEENVNVLWQAVKLLYPRLLHIAFIATHFLTRNSVRGDNIQKNPTQPLAIKFYNQRLGVGSNN